MRALEGWFEKVSVRRNNAVFLEDALLSNRFLSYAAFRLRYFMGTSLLSAALHVIEYTILAFIFAKHTLVLALLINIVSALVNAWWWGALESMRSQIRALRNNGKMHLIQKVITPWLNLTVVLSVTIFSLFLSWVIFDTLRTLHRFEPIHLFVIATGLQLSLNVLMRTYHSMVYAIRRIYRPFFVIVSFRILGFLGTVLVWPVCREWSYPLILIPLALMTTLLSYVYVSRMYNVVGFPSIREMFSRVHVKNLLGSLDKEFWLAGFAYVGIRLDNLIILALFYGAYQGSNQYELFIFFYLIHPFTLACYGWAQLFYFDLKRLDQSLLMTLKKKFDRFVSQVAWFIGLFFYGLACIIATFIMQKNLGILYLFLFFFFMARAHLAFFQIRAFATQNYFVLINMGLITLVYTLFLSSSVAGEKEKFVFYILVLFPMIFGLKPRFLGRSKKNDQQIMLAITDWLAGLKQCNRSVRVRSISISRSIKQFRVAKLAEQVMRVVPPGSIGTVLGNYRITWFEPQHVIHADREAALLNCGAGIIEKIQSTAFFSDGLVALKNAQQNGLLGNFVTKTHLENNHQYSISDVKERFYKQISNGVMFNVNQKQIQKSLSLSPPQYRELMYGAIQYSKFPFKRISKSSFDVTALQMMSDIRFIFGIPSSEALNIRNEWKSYINGVNVCSALGANVIDNENKNMLSYNAKRIIFRLMFVLALLIILLIPIHERATGSFQFQSAKRSEVRAPVPGFLRSINHDEGSEVKAGLLLAQLEVHDLQSQILRKKSEIEEAEAVLHAVGFSAHHQKVTHRHRVGGSSIAPFTGKTKPGRAISGKIDEYQVEYQFAKENFFWMKELYEKKVVGKKT